MAWEETPMQALGRKEHLMKVKEKLLTFFLFLDENTDGKLVEKPTDLNYRRPFNIRIGSIKMPFLYKKKNQWLVFS